MEDGGRREAGREIREVNEKPERIAFEEVAPAPFSFFSYCFFSFFLSFPPSFLMLTNSALYYFLALPNCIQQ